MRSKKNPTWLTIILVSLVTLTFLASAGLWIVQQRAIALRHRTLGCLSQAALLVENHENAKGELPPVFTTSEKGTRLHSWRVLCLRTPQADFPLTGIRMDEPWNSPANQAAAPKNRNYVGYFAPSGDGEGSSAWTLAVTGPHSLWDSKTGKPRGSIASMPDVVMLVAMPESKIDWMEPRDITESELRKWIEAGGDYLGITAAGKYGTLTLKQGALVIKDSPD